MYLLVYVVYHLMTLKFGIKIYLLEMNLKHEYNSVLKYMNLDFLILMNN